MKGDLVELNKHVTLSRLLFSVCFFGWEGEGSRVCQDLVGGMEWNSRTAEEGRK